MADVELLVLQGDGDAQDEWHQCERDDIAKDEEEGEPNQERLESNSRAGPHDRHTGKGIQ